ncbi:MAG: hypothetical protein WB586_05415, partial [Chthoniobacterales bacterium]
MCFADIRRFVGPARGARRPTGGPSQRFAIAQINANFRVLCMNYKETLNLPKTEFPMKANLTAR